MAYFYNAYGKALRAGAPKTAAPPKYGDDTYGDA